MKKEDFSFAQDLLNHISKKDVIRSQKVHDLASKWDVEEHYKEILRFLIHDGYCNNNEDPTRYRFNSPILQEWWYRNVSN